MKTDTVIVDRNVNFSQIADVCGLDIAMIRALNPAYRRDIVPGATAPSPIRLPINDISLFIDNQDSIYATESSTQKRMEVMVEEVASKKGSASDRKSKRSKNSKNAKYHSIRSGDNLGAIAKKYGTTVNKLKKLNGLKNNNIRAGQSLRVR